MLLLWCHIPRSGRGECCSGTRALHFNNKEVVLHFSTPHLISRDPFCIYLAHDRFKRHQTNHLEHLTNSRQVDFLVIVGVLEQQLVQEARSVIERWSLATHECAHARYDRWQVTCVVEAWHVTPACMWGNVTRDASTIQQYKCHFIKRPNRVNHPHLRTTKNISWLLQCQEELQIKK